MAATTSLASEFESRWKVFQDLQTELEANVKQFHTKINEEYKTRDKLLSKIKSQSKALKDLKEYADAAKVSSSALTNLKSAQKKVQKLSEDLTPGSGSIFVRLFLGDVNVRQYQDDERYKMKNEYLRFKSSTDFFFLGVTVINLVVLHMHRPMLLLLVSTLFQVWLLYYFVTLALRENILRMNGSQIRGWWIVHHYVSVILSIVILTWPSESPIYKEFLPQFLWFSIFQAGVQLLQNFYQRAKLYANTAMGRVDRMKVYTSDSSASLASDVSGFSKGLLALFPFLIFLQSFQLWNSYTLFSKLYISGEYNGLQSEWQATACSLLFFTLGCGNLYTTLATYKTKLVQSDKKDSSKNE